MNLRRSERDAKREGKGEREGGGRQIKAASHATQMIKNVNFNSISPARMRENERELKWFVVNQ